jgi:hypothetical protein
MERIPVQQFGAIPAPKSRRLQPSNTVILAMLITSVVLIMIGTTILKSTVIIEQPTSGPYTEYYRLIHRLNFAGQVMISVGVAILMLLGWTVATMRTDMAERVRQSALIATAIITAAWMVFFMLTLT